MSNNDLLKVAYVVKRYPRYSETFIVNEILAHETAGLSIEIFSLRPPDDSYFQDTISRVRARVNYLYLPSEGLASGAVTTEALKAANFWLALEKLNEVLPGSWARLDAAHGEEARNVYQALLLAREVCVKGIRHLHAHFGSDATSVARLAAQFAGISYTFTCHAKDIFHESVLMADLQRKLSDASAVITVSDYNLHYLHKTYGPVSTPMRRIYNGIDLVQFQCKSPQERKPRIIAVGRLVEKKGFEDLIDACAILRRSGNTFSCHIIGDGEREADLKAQIERLSLHASVKLLGSRPQREVIEEMHNAAVLVAPCVVGVDGNRDGLPTVLSEAMALGTPCISTDVTGIPEVLHHGETGLMVPQHDPAALAQAIERLLIDADLRVQLAVNARSLIEREFDVRSNTAILRGMFKEAYRQNLKSFQTVH